MPEQGDFGGPSFGGDQGGQSSSGGNTGGGRDPNTGPAIDQANAISGMANALDNAADAIQGSGFDPSAQALGGPAVQSGLAVGPSLGSKAREQRDFGTIAMQDYDPSTYDYDFSGQNLNVVSPLDQKEAFMGANPSVSLDSLGPTPSVGQLAAAIGVDPSTLGSVSPLDQKEAYMEANPLGANKAGAWDNPNTAYSPLENPNYSAWENPNNPLDTVENVMRSPEPGLAFGTNAVENAMRSPTPGLAFGTNAVEDAMRSPAPAYSAWENPNTAYSPLENPNYSAWENPNTNLNWTDGIVSPAITAPAISQVDSFSTFDDQTNPFGPYGHPAPHLGALLDAGPNVETPGFKADVESFDVQNAPATDPETTPAPKYGPKKGFVDHEEMYPDHAKKAAMAGVASVKSMLDGTHQGWIDDINEDMEKRGIELSHTLDGKAPNGIPFGQEGTNLSGKHSAADWGEYNAMFSPDENGVPVDENGIAMPGTEKQAQAGLGGVLQGIAYGMFSGLVNPDTSSGVVDPTASSGPPGSAISTSPLAGPGGAEGGDHPVNFMRSIYPWAASLPYSVLFNAAKYPDYLRLLIEADATGTELPMAVPQWILDGKFAQA